MGLCSVTASGCSREPATPPAVTRVPAKDVERSRTPPLTERPEAPRNVYAKPRADVVPPAQEPLTPKVELKREGVPQVVLTAGHAALCRVRVGDTMPAIRLPDLDGQERELASLYGENLTVVCFWKGDRALARAELADLGPDVVADFSRRGVAVVGIAVQEPADQVRRLAAENGTEFPNLLDSDGSAFAQTGAEKLPRTYLLDSSGTVLWFDIEYSRSTHRELLHSIRALLGE